MLHTKSQGHRPSGSGEEDFLRVFTIYGRGGHLGHVTNTIWTNFRSPILRSLHMKYEFNWPSSFRGEDVWKCWRTTDRRRTDDGRRSHWYTISSPMSLRLRWAKNVFLCLKIFFTFTSSVDPDEMPHYAGFHLGLYCLFCLFDLILYVTSTIFQLCRDWSSWVEQVLN